MNTETCHHCGTTTYPMGDTDQQTDHHHHRRGDCERCEECEGPLWEDHCERCGPMV